jgi:cell wall-associated NlpC family hydrolase
MEIQMENSGPQLITAGSYLPGYKAETGTIQIEDRIFVIKRVFDEENGQKKVSLANAAGKFINAPYLWGGRSLFGLDCSGFVQVVFKILD